MDRPVAEEFCVGEARYHPEHALLLGNAKPRLESDKIPQPARTVLAPELHNGMRPAPGPWVFQANGFQRTKTKRLPSARIHLFDRHAPGKIRDLVELVSVELVGRFQSSDEGVVFFRSHRAVQVSALIRALHRLLSITRCGEHHCLVDRFP